LPAPDARKRENWEDPATGREAQETVDGKNEAALIIQQAILDAADIMQMQVQTWI
jgi:hypothetical protein